MTEPWERFAREDAEFYIWTDLVRTEGPEALRKFFDSGRATANRLLESANPDLVLYGRCLEFGCGVGRITLPMAERFEEALGVDIAPTMLDKLMQNAQERDQHNVRGFLPSEPWDVPDSVDLAYSWIVFQHIEDWAVIVDAVDRIGRALKPDGVACLQFDTRPLGLAYRARFMVPAFALPKTWKPGIRRIRRSQASVRETLLGAGLRIVREQGAGGVGHLFVAVKAH